MDPLTLGAALLAGLVTFLNPCVLPLLPIVFGAAANAHRHGPLLLAAGLASSFTAVGLVVATLGLAIGLDGELFRQVSAALLLLFGALLLVPRAQAAVQMALAPVGSWAGQHSRTFDASGPAGQFGLGLLLGAMWSPCVGPTLGAATLLASQGQGVGVAVITMLLFGLGAALPLLLLGTLLRRRLAGMRGALGDAGRIGRLLLGGGMAIAGVAVLTGLDKRIETLFLSVSPAWLIEFTTGF